LLTFSPFKIKQKHEIEMKSWSTHLLGGIYDLLMISKISLDEKKVPIFMMISSFFRLLTETRQISRSYAVPRGKRGVL